ncbi:DUF389 domain-containing protein [Aureitalea marina]|uniref:DUF389 domain-containing protein n=1 Tax=Aureitalea marina TaxID=930804 RepID=A0A2S7KQR9_9FLAO|nr:DUF389 domain-containing protein [Aureitalea marina]PQB04979.1 hypothetical protein BST85_08795 [Aureitalea marina]
MENEDVNKHIEDQRKAVEQDAKGLYRSISGFLSKLLDIRQEVDRPATIEAIKADIPYRGATAWILVCSIFIASIGLNANSTAVVIGAMLISPLMGPILGLGLSVATNDIDTLRKALKNFGVMVALSVITALLFFWLFPLREESSELLARTRPDIRDVLIAFFGGAALIIARTKKGTIASVIFGVAIATALMPPLCTVGYGLAEGILGNPDGWRYAAGAMYLFLINSIFIALATWLILRILRFPLIKYANSRKRRNTSRIASFFAVLVMVPAGVTFYRVLKESSFETAAKRFIETELDALPNSSYMKKYATFQYRYDDVSTIELMSFGVEQIPESTVLVLENRMQTYSALRDCELVINQSGRFDDRDNEVKYLEAIRSRDSLVISDKNSLIDSLQRKVNALSKIEDDLIPFEEINKEVKINYPNLEEFSYSVTLVERGGKVDTVNYFNTYWKDNARRRDVESDKARLYEFLKARLKIDTLVLR